MYDNTLRKSALKEELAQRYDDKERGQMVKGLKFLIGFVFAGDVLYYSYGTPIFYLAAAVLLIMGAYALNRVRT